MIDSYIGKLVINTTRKGAREYKAEFVNKKGKTVSFPVFANARYFNDTVQGGDEAQIEVDGSTVIKCLVPGKEAIPQVKDQTKAAAGHEKNGNNYSPQGSQNMGRNSSRNSGRQADGAPRVWGKAPYNFVRYDPDAIIEATRVQRGCWSGEILCSLYAETPLLVSGKQKNGTLPLCSFQKIAGKPVIPGTAVKGMLRFYMEILSFSGLRPVSDKKLFWRTVAEKKYTDLFPEKMKGGFLRQYGADFRITPVEVKKIDPPREMTVEVLKTGKTIKTKQPNYYYFPRPGANSKDREVERDVVLRLWEQMSQDQKGRWPEEAIKKRLHAAPGLPVFYREKDGKIFELGFCRYFRIQYEYSPHDLAWPEKDRESIVDMAAAIFGDVRKNNAFAGRIAIAPFAIQGKEAGEKTIPGAGPKPTCLPFYLVQDEKKIKVVSNGTKNERTCMASYNDRQARLRGRKMYWHHLPDEKFFPEGNGNEKVAVRLRPLAAGAKGEFVIRINRLTDVELGCLFEALQLKPECRHKLGMGKPLGFGSVKLTIREARIEDVRQRYSSLARRLASPAASVMPAGQIGELRAAFRAHVLERARKFYPVGDFYQLPPIMDFFLLLNWESKPEPAEVANMTLREFGKNPLLPMPEKIDRYNVKS